MRKKIFALLIFIALGFSLWAQAMQETKVKDETLVFTDSLGRLVTLPKEIERIAPSGNVAQLALYAIAPEKLVGWASRISDDAMETFLEEVASLPVFGAFYGSKANLNKEALIVANPDVVIDIGEIKGDKENMVKELDRLSKEINIPVVFIEGYLENTPEMFKTLGKLLGKEEQGETLAKFSKNALEKGKNNRDKINKSIYYSSSSDGLNAIQSGSFHEEVIRYIGAKNVVDQSYSGSNGSISLEQIYLWDPDVIILSNEEAYKNAKTDKSWNELRAVKNNEIYLIPSFPYSFIDSPPATNRLIGIYWLGSVLAPDIYDDIDEKTKEYYSLFYHDDLTEDEIEDILDNRP